MNTDRTTDGEQQKSWRVVEITTHHHAPVNGPDLLVLSESDSVAEQIVQDAIENNVIWQQGIEDISTKTDTLDSITRFDSVMEWLTAIRSPNMAIWTETDPYGDEKVQKMGRDVARSLDIDTIYAN